MRTDGRNIDQTLGALTGEAALQRVASPEPPYPRRTGTNAGYYGLPLLKDVVWKWPIPAYFYTGGLAGASAALSAAAMLRDLRGLARAGRLIACGGAAVSTALLIEDLGLPRRFIYMLRVFRPSSPMNLGAWILSAFGTASAAALLPGVTGSAGTALAGVLGLPLAGYTAVLLSNTAVPIWQQARAALPPLFVASAAVSAASAMELLPGLDAREQRAVSRLAVAARSAELAAGFALERTIASKALRSGVAGALWKGAKLCTAASLLLSLARRLPRLRGLLGTTGALATRFAIFHAGKASARAPAGCAG